MVKRTVAPEHIKKMQAGRQAMREQKAAALEAVANPQFRKPAFWKGVHYELSQGIAAAIEKAAAEQKAARITELEEELVRLKAE